MKKERNIFTSVAAVFASSTSRTFEEGGFSERKQTVGL